MKHQNSYFITYEIPLGIYSIKENSEVVYHMGDFVETLKFEYHGNSMKTKPILNHFGSTSGTLRDDEKIFFNIFLDFTSHWDYTLTNANHAYSRGAYTCERIKNLSTKDKTH